MRTSNKVLLVLTSLALGLGLLLLAGAILGALFFKDPVWAIAAGLLIILALTIMATKGRYTWPTLRQYILTFIISLVPIIGLLYVSFFAGKFLASHKVTAYIVIAGLLIALLGVSYLYIMNRDLQDFVSAPLEIPTPTVPLSSPTPIRRASPTFTPKSSPTEEVAAEPSETPVPQVPDCTLWSEITNDDIGNEQCVYGVVLQGTLSGDGEKVILDFGGMFQIWSLDVRIETGNFVGQCVLVKRTVDSTSSNRPIIVVRNIAELEFCP